MVGPLQGTHYPTVIMECPVCYDVVATVSLSCTHKMCAGCTDKWFRLQPTCPMCRAPVPELQYLSKSLEAARQTLIDATPVLTLDMQIDFDDDDDDDYDEYEAAYMESLRERRRRGRQPVDQSNIVGW